MVGEHVEVRYHLTLEGHDSSYLLPHGAVKEFCSSDGETLHMITLPQGVISLIIKEESLQDIVKLLVQDDAERERMVLQSVMRILQGLEPQPVTLTLVKAQGEDIGQEEDRNGHK